MTNQKTQNPNPKSQRAGLGLGFRIVFGICFLGFGALDMVEPLITVVLIAFAIAFNKPISDALLKIGDTMPKKPAIVKSIGSPKLPPVFVSQGEPDANNPFLAIGQRVFFRVSEMQLRPATVVGVHGGRADLWIFAKPEDGPQFLQPVYAANVPFSASSRQGTWA